MRFWGWRKQELSSAGSGLCRLIEALRKTRIADGSRNGASSAAPGATCASEKSVIFAGFPQDSQGCGKLRKNSFEVLDIEQWCSKITNGSALAKSVEPCRGFTVGSAVIQGTDPIVRRLISTG